MKVFYPATVCLWLCSLAPPIQVLDKTAAEVRGEGAFRTMFSDRFLFSDLGPFGPFWWGRRIGGDDVCRDR